MTLTRWGAPTPEELEQQRQKLIDHPWVPVATALEQAILDDVFARTNWFAWRVGGLETSQPRIAAAVLPVLREWIGRLAEHPNYRAGVYSCFVNAKKLARPFLDDLIQWYCSEKEPPNKGFLCQALIGVADAGNAPRLWRLCRREPPPPGHDIWLMVTLSRFPAVEREVKNELYARLLAMPHRQIGVLQEISKVRDPRIRDWFKQFVTAKNRDLRSIARRCVEKGAKLPVGLRYAERLPDRDRETFSCEIDVSDISAELRGIAKNYGIKIPPIVRRARFLETAELDRWIIAQLASAPGSQSELWFRLEDYDVVEIVLYSATSAPPAT